MFVPPGLVILLYSSRVNTCVEIKILRRVLNRRVDLHAIDAALLLDGVAMPVHRRWKRQHGRVIAEI